MTQQDPFNQQENDDLNDLTYVICTTCEEEFNWPTCLQQCPFCDNNTLEEC